MHKFELPYNQQKDWFDYAQQYKHLLNQVTSVYTAAWKEDAECTRKQLLTTDYAPKTWEEYVEHIKQLQRVGVNVNILMQRGVTEEAFKKYYDLGIRTFTMSDDLLVLKLKEKYPDIYVICSITKGLKYEDFFTVDMSMYDNIVLPFYFNRWISGIRTLPTHYKYTILANSSCCAYCDIAQKHWFNPLGNAEPCKYENDPYAMHINIDPVFLPIFDPYIDTYKLVDREAPSELIFKGLSLYANQVDHFDDYAIWMQLHKK